MSSEPGSEGSTWIPHQPFQGSGFSILILLHTIIPRRKESRTRGDICHDGFLGRQAFA